MPRCDHTHRLAEVKPWEILNDCYALEVARPALLLLIAASGCRLNFDETRVANVDAQSTTIDAPDRPNRAFLTKATFTGAIGGLSGADAACQQEATQAGIPGTFVAFLRAGAASPVDRLASSRGWVDVTGKPIVDMPSGWLTGRMFHPLFRDSTNAPVIGNGWLGTTASGTCSEWTSTAGTAGSVSSTTAYNEFTQGPCTVPHFLACLEVGHVAEVVPTTTVGRLSFLSKQGWVPGGGVAGADALCASEAASAGLAGSYLAMLTTSTTDGFARFSLTGPTWTRVDGIALAPSAVAVAGVDDLDTFTILQADGTPNYTTASNTWTGSAASNCSNWTTTAGMGVSGNGATTTRSRWRDIIDAPCTNARRLICLQE